MSVTKGRRKPRMIHVMRGLPASGKTTHAKKLQENHPNIKRVSKDDLRAMLQLGKYTPESEELILTIRNKIIELAIRHQHDIIVDDTNLNPVHITELTKLAEKLFADIDIIDMDTPVEECVRRDQHRYARVGAQVIFNMYEKYINKEE